MQVISRWPLDPTKEGRDLAVYIRARVAGHFPSGELSELDPSKVSSLEKEIQALERLVNNTNKYRYANLDNTSTASGLTVETLSRATSSQMFNELDQFHETGLLTRIKLRFESLFK